MLVLRRPSRAEVRLPKGHVEPGESLADAALREVREETGYVDLFLKADLGTQIVEYNQGYDHVGRHVVRDEHYFLVELDGDAARREPSDPKFEPVWIAGSEAEASLTFEAEREWVRRALRAQSPSAIQQRACVCLSTGSLHTYGIARVFEVASEAGFDGVELLVDDRWDARHPAYLRRLAQSHGLPIVAVHSPFVPEVAGWPAGQLGRLHRTVALAQDLNVAFVVAHLPQAFGGVSGTWHGSRPRRFSLRVPWPRRGSYDRFLRDELAEFEVRERITVCVENMPATRLLGFRANTYRHNDPDQLRQFPHLVLDTTHLGTWGLDLLEVYTTLRANVSHVHLSDYDFEPRRSHRSPADGQLPLGQLLQRLAADRYSGAIAIEASPAGLNAEQPAACMAMLRGAVAFCRQNLRIAEPTQ